MRKHFWTKVGTHQPNSVLRRSASDISQTQKTAQILMPTATCRMAGFITVGSFHRILKYHLNIIDAGTQRNWDYCSYTISFHFSIPCFIAPMSVLLCPWWTVLCNKGQQSNGKAQKQYSEGTNREDFGIGYKVKIEFNTIEGDFINNTLLT